MIIGYEGKVTNCDTNEEFYTRTFYDDGDDETYVHREIYELKYLQSIWRSKRLKTWDKIFSQHNFCP